MASCIHRIRDSTKPHLRGCMKKIPRRFLEIQVPAGFENGVVTIALVSVKVKYAQMFSFNLNFFAPECSAETPYITKWLGYLATGQMTCFPNSPESALCLDEDHSSESCWSLDAGSIRKAQRPKVIQSCISISAKEILQQYSHV